jgi:hypothetical protein
MSQSGSLNNGGGGGGTATVEKINVQTGTSPVVTNNNTITFNGAVVAAGSNPVRTDGTGPATMALEVQTAQAIASTDATKIGLASFNSADFTVDANGFVSTTGSSGIATIDGDVGSVTGSTVTFNANSNSGSSVVFSGSGTTMDLKVTDSDNNTIVGGGAGNSSPGHFNTCFGNFTGTNLSSSPFNTLVGYAAGFSISSGDHNTVFGANTGPGSGGTYNIIMGLSAGSSLSGNETSNILIGTTGTSGDNNVIRIGTQGGSSPSSGTQTTCYVAGIISANSSGFTTPKPVYVDSSTGQLGYGSAGSGVTTIDGDSGSVTGSTVTFNGHSQAGSSVSFSGSGTTMSFNTSDSNHNTMIGLSAGNASISGAANVGIGYQALASLTSGATNVGIGSGIAPNLTSGTTNTLIGAFTAANYTSSESSNILIRNTGTTGDNHVIRIGTNGTGGGAQSSCFIAGIEGATYSGPSPTPALTYCDTTHSQIVSTLAVASATVTTNFGQIAVGTALQNTANYAILVNVSLVITAATSATIIMGIGSTSSPSTSTVVTTFSTAASEIISFSGFVPAGYYILVNTTGTITVGSITTQSCAVG